MFQNSTFILDSTFGPDFFSSFLTTSTHHFFQKSTFNRQNFLLEIEFLSTKVEYLSQILKSKLKSYFCWISKFLNLYLDTLQTLVPDVHGLLPG